MRLGIDIGGTNIKFGVVDNEYEILKKYIIPTQANKGNEQIVADIISKCQEIYGEYAYERIGIGTAGDVDSERGICVKADNLPWENTPIVNILENEVGVKVTVANDATCAICGELCAGAGRRYSDFIMITLGTGVGGGICIEGKPYFGKSGAAGEFGHMIIRPDGRQCGCGRRGGASSSTLLLTH